MRARQTRRELMILGALICVALVVGSLQTLAVRRADAPPVVTYVPTTNATPFPTPSDLPPGNDWTQYRFDLTGTGVNPEDLLTTANVSQLAQRWAVNGSASYESTPAVVNGVIYIANGRALYAYDLRSGKTLWRYDVTAKGIRWINSSVAVDPATHLAYFGTPDAYVYAVDVRTGTGVWSEQIGDATKGAYIWSSPLVANGKVYIGLASNNDQPCVRGAVFAFDAKTGKEAWVHYTEQAGRLGGGVWSSVTADTQRGEIIATTGNPCSTHTSDAEQDAIIGINWNTGETNWKYTALENDACDCDFGGGAVSYTLNGKDYIVAGNKQGTIYALVRQGKGVKLAWTRRVAQVETPRRGGIYQPPSYKDGIVYFGPGTGVDNSCPSIWALKADTGDVVWRVCLDYRPIGPAAITGDLLFVAERGKVLAMELKTGHVVWQAAQPGDVWGGVAISRGFIVVGSVLHELYCYSLPAS